MATIEQYTSGEAAQAVRLAYEAMQALEEPLPGSKLSQIFTMHLEDLKPVAVDKGLADDLIANAKRCAVGDRLCKCEFPDAPSTRAVFLNELADAMVEAGKAVFATKEEAVAALSEHKGKPLVISKVSGEYREICRTWPGYCFYWNMEKNGMKCLERKKSPTSQSGD